MATKTTTGNFDDRQSEIDEARTYASDLDDALVNAESCETPEDFDANIAEAQAGIEALLKLVKEIRS
jgi:hypothetical protein